MAGVLRARRALAGCCLLATLLCLAPRLATARGGVEMTDMAGRKVRVPERVERVVPLGGALRFLVYLRSLDLVAGVEDIENKRRSAARLYGMATAEMAGRLPVIGEGGPGKLPDFERIVALWPDLIVAMGLDAAQVETIQAKTGIPVFALSYGGAGALDTGRVREAFRVLGALLHREQRARELVEYLEGATGELAARSAAVPAAERPAAYVGALSFKGAQGVTSTEAFHAPLAWAGGANVVDQVGRPGHLFIDPEQLLLWNPGTLFLDAGNLETVREDFRKNPGYYRKLKAVRDGRVFLTMPYNAYHTNIEIALADAFFMAKALYPDRCADIDPAAKADEIFTFFTGVAAYGPLAGELHGFGRVDFGEDDLVVVR